MKTQLEKKRLYKEAFRLLKRANHLLDEAYKAHLKSAQRASSKAA